MSEDPIQGPGGAPWQTKGSEPQTTDLSRDRTKDIESMTKMFKAMKSMSTMGTTGQILKILEKLNSAAPVMDLFTEFLDVFYGGLEAGLGEAVEKIAKALFTKDNVELMTELGEIFGEVMSLGFIPLLQTLKELRPILKAVLPYIKEFAKWLKEIKKFLKKLKLW